MNVGQSYLMNQTRLGIPVLFQSKGLHGFPNDGTIWAIPIAVACSFNRDLVYASGKSIGTEAEDLRVTHPFAPVLDLARELRFRRVEEGFSEDLCM